MRVAGCAGGCRTRHDTVAIQLPPRYSACSIARLTVVFVCLAPPNAPAGKYDQVRINFANPDMVGHTGDLAATVACCTLVDACVAELLAVVDEMGGRFLLTSDHGNADDMAQVGGWVGG